MVQARGIAEADGVGCGEQAEVRIGPDHAVLVEQGQLALLFEHALDHEHHVRAARVVFVEHQRHRVLQCPGQQAFAEFGHLQPVAQHDRVATDKVDTADMRVEINPHAGPVEPRGDLFDMRRFAGAVIALHHHAAVVRETRQDRQRGVRIEDIGLVQIGRTLVRLGESGHLPVDIDPECLAHIDGGVGRGKDGLGGSVEALVGHIVHRVGRVRRMDR